jgi:hypothetical protein
MARAAAPDARRPRAGPPHGFHRLSAIPAKLKRRTLAAGPSSPIAPPELVLGADRLSVLEFAERDAPGSALRHDTISMVGLAQRQAPWLCDGRKHPIARSVHAVRQASSPSPRGVATPVIPPSGGHGGAAGGQKPSARLKDRGESLGPGAGGRATRPSWKTIGAGPAARILGAGRPARAAFAGGLMKAAGLGLAGELRAMKVACSNRDDGSGR